MQAVCAHYAKLYNEHEPPLKVQYAKSWLLKVCIPKHQRPIVYVFLPVFDAKLLDRGDIVCSIEDYLPGLYVKYSNNNGFVGKETSTTEERERNTPQVDQFCIMRS
jgi:hypothetical protein